jgi:multiple sugar transport system permease protein/raffinose/stachyose/melibiose transport system permease protein
VRRWGRARAVGPAPRLSRPAPTVHKHKRFWQVALLALPLAVFGTFVVWPLSSSFFYSLTNWNGFNAEYRFVGLANFARIGADPLFLGAIVNTAIWMLAAIVLPTGLGLALALLLDARAPGTPAFKTIFYLPVCLSSVVVGQIWVWIYHPDWGLLNTLIGLATRAEVHYAWLAKPDTALVAVIIAWTWQQTGLAMVIFLAGLTAIPAELIEACHTEGASARQRIWHVVLPLLQPATVVVVALNLINSLKGFDILYVTTGGGPFHSSDTLAMHMYNESFKKYHMGYGSAIAVVLFMIALSIIFIYFRQLRKSEGLYD